MKTFTEWEATTDGYSNSEKNLMELAWNASAENSAEEIERLRNAAPEVDQEPVAFRILRKNFDGEWVDDHRCWCNGKPDPNLIEDIAKRSDRWRIEYSYAIHPDAQAEIAKRDERIESLTAAGAEYQRQCFEQAERINELEEQLFAAQDARHRLGHKSDELAAQNQQLREALNEAGRLYCTMIGNDLMHNPSMFARNTVCTYVRSWFRKCKPKVIESALSLPDLASPVLNRVNAEALRNAANEFDARGEW